MVVYIKTDPRSKHVLKNNSVSMPTEEDNVGDGNEDWYAHVLIHHLQIEISFCKGYLWFPSYIVVFHVMMVEIESWLLDAVMLK